MRLPYGIMNFKRIRDENRVYVEKTRFIEMLEKEDNPYPFFIRPRRFGKSLFLSLLEYYYDILYKDEFDHLFGDLYIGKHPTPLKNNLVVLSLDFSGLETKNEELFKESFTKSVNLIVPKILRKIRRAPSCSSCLRGSLIRRQAFKKELIFSPGRLSRSSSWSISWISRVHSW